MRFSALKYTILTFTISLNIFLFSSAYNGTDLLKELVGEQSNTSDTNVLYRGVRKDSEQYQLLQGAIDRGYIANKALRINLNKEFTPTSLRSFARLYAKVHLPISSLESLDEQTWQTSIELIRTGYKTNKKPFPTTTEAIQNELIRLLERNRLSDQKRINELMKLLGTDPYAKSYEDQQAQDFENSLKGELTGIGISIEQQADNAIRISHVYEGPAKIAGLQQGDTLIRIDDMIVTKNTSLTQVGELIQGKVNTKVIVVVLRNDKVYEYSITRKKIIIDPIILESLNNTTTLMTISMFQTNTYDSFKEKLSTITSNKNLIIDLRNNLGGSLQDTKRMLDHFIPKGQPLYHIQENNGTLETTYSQGRTISINPQTPIYLLTNHDTASASEIFAGVIREYYPHSHIIGTKTYGKGTVQTVWSNDKHQTVKFTTGQRLLGKTKTSIDGKGLQPDVVLQDNITTPQDELIEYVFNQL